MVGLGVIDVDLLWVFVAGNFLLQKGLGLSRRAIVVDVAVFYIVSRYVMFSYPKCLQET